MIIHEVILNDEVVEQSICFSQDGAAENSRYGSRPNDKTDIEGNRIFFAEDEGTVTGYLFGKVYQSEQMKSIMPEENHPCFLMIPCMSHSTGIYMPLRCAFRET